MAQESQVGHSGTDASTLSAEIHNLNIPAIEDAMVDGLSKIPVVKRVLYSRRCMDFDVIIVHSSDKNADALVRIVDRMLEIEKQVKKSGDAPNDIYMEHIIIQESVGYPYSDHGMKILYERK